MLPRIYKNPINTAIRYAVTTLAYVARVYKSLIDADIRYAVMTLVCVARVYKNLIDADISYAIVMLACVSRAVTRYAMWATSANMLPSCPISTTYGHRMYS